MQVRIDLTGKVPLRDQLVEQIKLEVATGRLRPGEQLPTVRDLARHLGLNASTVAKAYGELERSGVILTRRGGGSFVADLVDERFLIDARVDRLNAILANAAVQALSLGYDPDEVEARFGAQLARWREARKGKDAPAAPDNAAAEQARFAGSHDIAVELLFSRLRRTPAGRDATVRYTGSLAGLMALEQGEANIAGSHLLDEETGEYNLPFVRRLLPAEDVVAITLVERWQGLIVRRGNPKRVQGLPDLVRPELVFVNRQRGAGTRVLLDSRLRALGIGAGEIRGYEREEGTHIAVAGAIADGSADVGLGIEPAARAAGLDFVPLRKERYDLVMHRAAVATSWFAALRVILEGEDFRNVVAAMEGYDVSRCGHLAGE